MFDLLIRGGSVLDGAGTPPVRGDVGVRDGRIAAVGVLDDASAGDEIDATGRYVTPGFVDTHCHAEAALFRPDVQLALLRQGVTTVLVGQDGLSFAPASPTTVEYVSSYFAAIVGRHPAFGGGTVGELLATYDGTTPVNAAYLVPHGTLRYEVLGPATRAAEPAELDAMRKLVEAGLADGAVGLSSGLEYAPGRYADADELAYLCAPLGDRPYVTHMRGYGARAPVGMGEASEIVRKARVPLHVSHYHGPAAELLALLDGASAMDCDVTFDSYPYLRASSILGMVALPDWLPTADLAATTAALGDPTVRDRLRAGWADERRLAGPAQVPAHEELWQRITLACVTHPDWTWTEGLTVGAAAARAGLDPADFAIELLIADRLQVGCVFERRPPTTEESVRTLLRDDRHTGGSDAIYLGGHPHPRAFGAFGRLLGRHVRELGDWTWPEAVVHLAARPAARFGLADRGSVAPGAVADLVVLDPARVGDRATYESPRELAEGIDDVLVAGVPVLAGGALTGARPGRGIRRQGR